MGSDHFEGDTPRAIMVNLKQYGKAVNLSFILGHYDIELFSLLHFFLEICNVDGTRFRLENAEPLEPTDTRIRFPLDDPATVAAIYDKPGVWEVYLIVTDTRNRFTQTIAEMTLTIRGKAC